MEFVQQPVSMAHLARLVASCSVRRLGLSALRPRSRPERPLAAALGLGACAWGAALAAREASCEAVPAAGDARLAPVLGVWQLDRAASESLCPFIGGLGTPGARYVCRLVDAVSVTLRISLEDDGEAQIVDKSVFGRNVTRFPLDGAEKEVATRGGRKKFMLSGWRTSRGGVAIRCRLFQRGDGWETLMERHVMQDGRLEELNILRRPGHEDVVVRRYFSREGDLTP